MEISEIMMAAAQSANLRMPTSVEMGAAARRVKVKIIATSRALEIRFRYSARFACACFGKAGIVGVDDDDGNY